MAARKTAQAVPTDEKPDSHIDDEGTIRHDDETTEAEAKVQTAVDQENAQGFRGTEVDKTPNEAYTVQGVGADMPTPETDPDLAQEAQGPVLTKFNNKQ